MILGRIKTTTDLAEAVQDADLVVEAVFGNLALKQDIFKRVDQIAPQHAIFGSNTSTLPIAAIAGGTGRLDKFVGIHFMNPVPLMKGVELIRGRHTSDETLQISLDYVKSLGKETAIYAPVAVDSGNVALEYGVAREEQDELAYASHRNYGAAWERGFFHKEMTPLEIVKRDKKGKVISNLMLDKDEQYRSDITPEALTKLKPIFGNPTCTAGNAPGMNDGAAAQIFTTRGHAEELGLEMIYTLVSIAAIALQPRIMPVSPVFAIKKCLDEAKLTMADLKYLEINEAFACVPLVSCKLLSNDRFLSSDYQDMVKEASEKPILDNDAAMVRKFTKNEIIPVAAEYDQKNEMPWPIIQKGFEIGLWNFNLPLKYNGLELDHVTEAILIGELAYGCLGISGAWEGNTLALTPILIAGTEEQQD
ncbi:3-hydroxyacyl-CoA dehydrogenase NAD-binding domain-containing protein [Desulfosporosinus sp. BICA1-9]|uniref:3-hydroxyacyl-CoA dehydrogenase NAD-binding domain-containing protein n=1 Tax=Desulfosporosinus sp. BICA1-9 TaxID=1531958 RepID=UPI000A734948|nr:3-hydroxyacyl-CoA dehydrogenase NAD-binding domain-containing protein [Desulfosporosinus sp. BICA1-9]HBW38114.1 hypothetical protein [Desulfosporosinus sp.]